jgi:hypothetical protein
VPSRPSMARASAILRNSGAEGGASHGRAGGRPWPPPGRSDPASGRPEPTTLPDSRREHPRCAACARADCVRTAQVIRALGHGTQNFCYAQPPRDLRECGLESVINRAGASKHAGNALIG